MDATGAERIDGVSDKQFPGLNFPRGSELSCELFFHEGQTTNTTTQVINKVYPYNSLDVVNAMKQLMDAKADAFQTTISHVKQFDEDNPKGYIAWVRTLWFTGQTSREVMTAFMRGVQVSGVPANF